MLMTVLSRTSGASSSFCANGHFLRLRLEYLDQALWTILDEDWKAKTVWSGKEGMIIH